MHVDVLTCIGGPLHGRTRQIHKEEQRLTGHVFPRLVNFEHGAPLPPTPITQQDTGYRRVAVERGPVPSPAFFILAHDSLTDSQALEAYDAWRLNQ